METKKIHWKKAFDSDYLGACDLEDGRDLKLIIKSAEVRKIKGNAGEEQNRNIAIFTDTKIKPMVLNSGNCNQPTTKMENFQMENNLSEVNIR